MKARIVSDKDLLKTLNELFKYKDGRLIRRKSVKGKNASIGSIAGTPVSDGYINICINQKKYRAHRLIWLMHYGRFPVGDIDHINGVRSDNKIENLREVKRKENCRNQQKRSDNKSGVTGVCFNKGRGKWEAYIKHSNKKKNLGLFDCKNEAITKRKWAEKEYSFHKNHGRFPINNEKAVLISLGRG